MACRRHGARNGRWNQGSPDRRPVHCCAYQIRAAGCCSSASRQRQFDLAQVDARSLAKTLALGGPSLEHARQKDKMAGKRFRKDAKSRAGDIWQTQVLL